MRHFIWLPVCVAVLAAGFSAPADAQAKVPARPAKADAKDAWDADTDERAIKPPTEEEVQEAKEWAMGLGQKAKQVAPKMQMMETPNFYLFSAFENKAADKIFRDTATQMYTRLCKQFEIKPREAVWLDKCPIFAFKTKSQYVAFLRELDMDADQIERMRKASGFAWWRSDGKVFIVLNETQNATQFYDVMVHEGTHAFMARYLTTRPLPTWVNEGFADHMCAELLKNSPTQHRWQWATRQVLEGKENAGSIFAEEWRIESFDYGMAHSLVRYMIRKDGKAFTKFVRLLKQGESEEKALRETYKTDRAGLVKGWWAVAAKTIK